MLCDDRGMSDAEYPISIEENYRHNTTILSFQTEHGTLDATYDATLRWFCIANLDVDPKFRGEGRAKFLLSTALNEAERQGAKIMYAAILSRECIRAMIGIFGSDAVIIEKLGTFTPDKESNRYDAAAILRYEIK
jgi:GNAT superfamily N-acetyltransferase